MKRLVMFLSLFLAISCLSSAALAYNFVFDNAKNEYDMGARIDATMALMYDTFTNTNRVFVYGGRGKAGDGSEIFMDLNGDLWSTRLDHAYYLDGNIFWDRIHPDEFKLRDNDNPGVLQDEVYPPLPRYGHSAVLCPVTDDSIIHNNDGSTLPETYLNYIVFGGMKQTDSAVGYEISGNEELTDQVLVLAEYMIDTGSGKTSRYHWYEIDKPISGTWPSARKYAQIVPLFNEQDPPDERNKFLLFGGVDANGICNDAFVGTFSRDTDAVTPEGNEWEFCLNLSVQFEHVAIVAGSPASAITVYGGGAVYDPYFFHESGNSDPTPRVVIVGGKRENLAGEYVSSDVIVLTANNGDWSEIIVDETGAGLPGLNDQSTNRERAFHSCSINYRDEKIELTGGEKDSGYLNDIGSLSLTDSTPEWSFATPTTGVFPAVSHHCSVNAQGDTVFCAVNWNTNTPLRRLFIDQSNRNVTKIWDISKTGLYGLNNPESVTNTRRLGKGDTIKIHQTNDYSGAINDAFECQINIPVWHKNITIEGVVYNGFKPVLYQQYGSSEDYETESYILGMETGDYPRDNTSVLFAHNTICLRNLKICHFDFEVTNPQTSMPTTIPSAKLTNYSENQSGINWNFIHHHTDDPGIFMHTESLVENCEFALNGVGISMICVSSSSESTEIKNCVFENNFIGLLALEKEHWIRYNRFEDNYLAGLALDKGCRSVICENLFTGNGHLVSLYGLEAYKSGILSDFTTTARVPLIQTPFIFNNTFDSNYRALSVTEFTYDSQYMNRPFFFNNIVNNESATKSSIYLMDQGGRCDVINRHNCFNLPTGIDVIQLGSSSMAGVVSQNIIEADPRLQSSDYSIYGTSPCINKGLYILEPGVISEMGYPDYDILDIGYHYPLYTGSIPDAPQNLRIESGNELHWDSPSSVPDDYLVFIEYDSGIYSSSVVSPGSNQHYEYTGDETHLWFGVVSRNNQQIYSECIWLEWSE